MNLGRGCATRGKKDEKNGRSLYAGYKCGAAGKKRTIVKHDLRISPPQPSDG
jgi:hypothetical protein